MKPTSASPTDERHFTSANAIDISPVSGFPERLPEECMIELSVKRTIADIYSRHGFTQIETPIVERTPVLTAKGGMNRLLFGLSRPSVEEANQPELAVRFDLTVPTARYVVHHAKDLVFPFRRSQIQPVMRGERAQRGRYREFTQADIDIIGQDSLPHHFDSEFPAVIADVFLEIGVPDFTIHVSDRRIWNDVKDAFALSKEIIENVLRILDKSVRDGMEATQQRLSALGLPTDVTDFLFKFCDCQTIVQAQLLFEALNIPKNGLNLLSQTLDAAIQLGCPAAKIKPDYTIARGLDYYTGTVFETFIEGKYAWGSVCSGGRYDDLASHFSRQRYPGVGISIGVTRLVSLLLDSGFLVAGAKTPAQIILTVLSENGSKPSGYLSLVKNLREAGISTIIGDPLSSHSEQLRYGANLLIPFAVQVSQKCFDDHDTVRVKDLRHHGEWHAVSCDELVSYMKRQLAL